MSLEVAPDQTVDRLRCVAHPVRLDMLSLLTGASLSAAQVSRELGITQANASYHLRRLLTAGLLVIDGEERVNGGVAKKYRHPWRELSEAEDERAARRSTESGSHLVTTVEGERERLANVTTMADAIPRRFARRRRAGTEGYFADIDTWVTPQVWAEAVALLRQASELMHSQASAPRAEGTVRGSFSVASFRLEETR